MKFPKPAIVVAGTAVFVSFFTTCLLGASAVSAAPFRASALPVADAAARGGQALLAPNGTCTAAQRAQRKRALSTFRKQMAKQRAAYFRRHLSRSKRAKFLKQQSARVRTLTRAANCAVAVATPPTPRVSAPTADLAITMTGAPGAVSVGANVTYTITVANSGPNTASQPALTDVLPAQVSFISVAGTTGTTCVGGSTVRCSFNGPATYTITLTVKAISSGTVANTATVASATADPQPTNNSATASVTINPAPPPPPPPSADLAVSIAVSPQTVTVGDNLTYTIAVENRGPDAASQVALTDVLPSRVTFVSATNTTATCSGAFTIRCNGTPPFTITLTVKAFLSGTGVGNTATATSTTADPQPANNSASASITINPAPPPPPALGTRQNPHSLGALVALGGNWSVKVTNVYPDATAAILAANMFNDPPKPGHVFFMVAVQATYTGTGSSRLDSMFRFRAVGASNVGYTSFTNSCGVLPNPNLMLDDPEVFTGGTVPGNAACWEIPASDAASLVMYDHPFLSTAPDVFLSLR
jgi:uncharacterized repeat protein (TIGR01451 family)